MTTDISFDGEAFDTEIRIIDSLKGYCVRVTEPDGSDTDIELIGVDSSADSSDHTWVRGKVWDEDAGEGRGEIVSLAAAGLFVY